MGLCFDILVILLQDAAVQATLLGPQSAARQPVAAQSGRRGGSRGGRGVQTEADTLRAGVPGPHARVRLSQSAQER